MQRRTAYIATFLLALAALALLAGCAAPVRVEWTTETEVNTAGFNLYRAESAAGPFDHRVNTAIIPAAPDPMTGGSYSFLDHSVQHGITYYYMLEEIESNGATNTFGPLEVRAGGFTALELAALALAGLGLAAVGSALYRRRAAATKPGYGPGETGV